MEKLKPSEEEIIKLGKKIVEELQLEPSVNTLGRWMSHYLSELIHKIDDCNSETEKKETQKECCEVIIKLWNNRENLPNVSTPLNELNPLIKVLKKLKKDESDDLFFTPFRQISEGKTWENFVHTVKTNSESIIELCLLSCINSDFLQKRKEWIEKHKNMLDSKELELFESLEYLINKNKSFVVFYNEESEEKKLEELSIKERYEAIFEKIGSELNEQQNKLRELKEQVLSDL